MWPYKMNSTKFSKSTAYKSESFVQVILVYILIVSAYTYVCIFWAYIFGKLLFAFNCFPTFLSRPLELSWHTINLFGFHSDYFALKLGWNSRRRLFFTFLTYCERTGSSGHDSSSMPDYYTFFFIWTVLLDFWRIWASFIVTLFILSQSVILLYTIFTQVGTPIVSSQLNFDNSTYSQYPS